MRGFSIDYYYFCCFGGFQFRFDFCQCAFSRLLPAPSLSTTTPTAPPRPDKKYFHHRLFRESCLAVEGNFLKDLNVLGRDLSKTILVDNSPHAFGYQVDNGVPIESWFDQEEDRELLKLERFLRQISHVSDVRDACRQKFQCRHRVESAPDYPSL